LFKTADNRFTEAIGNCIQADRLMLIINAESADDTPQLFNSGKIFTEKRKNIPPEPDGSILTSP